MADTNTSAPTRRGALTEQLHVLVDLPTKDFIIGLATHDARSRGFNYIRQGEAIRDLLEEVIALRRSRDPEEFDRLSALGRATRQ